MEYQYFVQAFHGRPMKCPKLNEDQYFQAIQEMTGCSPKIAKALLQMGVGINSKEARFFATPKGRLTPLLDSALVQ